MISINIQQLFHAELLFTLATLLFVLLFEWRKIALKQIKQRASIKENYSIRCFNIKNRNMDYNRFSR